MKKINIKGPIIPSNHQWIYNWLDMEATSPKSINEQLSDANGEDLEVIINSGGGSAFDGSDIFTSLKDYSGNVTVKIVGVAASAASVIAMAGNKILMSPTAQIMIHNSAIRADGDYRTMDRVSGILRNVNQTIVNAYKMKTGKSDDDLLKMMDDETWFTPQQAMENKFIDEIMFEEDVQIVASADYSGALPQQVINKIRDEFKPSVTDEKDDPEKQQKEQAQAKLNLLKLGGKIDD